MKDTVNVTLVGVGGQGILLTSEILGRAAALAGFDVKKSEVHGMSQRGGSVTSQVRFGRHVYSPVIPFGETDVLVAFEKLEAVRCFALLSPGGKALVDVREIVPVTVSSGQQVPVADQDGVLARLYEGRAVYTDSCAVARKLGNMRTSNMVIAGALSMMLDIPGECWVDAIKARLPEKIRDINIRAFEEGCAGLSGTSV